MSEEFDREERAFAEALKGSLEGESFRPLDPEELKAAAGPQRRATRPWGRELTAAAAVVLVVLGAGLVLPRVFGSASSTSSSSVAAVPEAAGGAAAPMDVSDKATQLPVPRATHPQVISAADWTTTSTSPLSPRSNAIGAWLGGEFYLIGGQSDPPCPPNASCVAPDQLLRDGAAYNPSTDSWRRIADAPVALSEGDAVVVGERIYLQRGYGTDVAVYAYDATADAWSRVPSPAGGGVLVALDDQLGSVAWSTEEPGAYDELWDPLAMRWTRLPADPLGKAYERTMVRAGGRVLLFAKDVRTGSTDKAPVFRLAELDPATATWRRLADSEVVGIGGRTVGDRVVFPELGSYDGGDVDNWGRKYPAGGIFDPATSAWVKLPGPVRHDEGLESTRSVVAGAMLLSGGRLLDPVQPLWIAVPEPPTGNLLGQTVTGSPDGILVFGGWNGTGPSNRASYLPLR